MLRKRARVLSRLIQILPMAYDDITFPLEARLIMRKPKLLNALDKKARKLFRSEGYRKVFTYWHYFGEHGEKYHPHLNVLYDGRWLTPQELASLKDKIRRKLLPRSMAKLIKKDLVIHHQYTRSPKKAMHWIKYVVRPTFLEREWDEPLADALYRFRPGGFAGFWNDPPKWPLTHKDKKLALLARLQDGLHPISGKPITWSRKLIPWVLVLMREPVHLGGWWYLLPPIRPPPGLCRSP